MYPVMYNYNKSLQGTYLYIYVKSKHVLVDSDIILQCLGLKALQYYSSSAIHFHNNNENE